ncbi:hypothetical protein GCM10010525_30400 [Glutamicibacter bergerei]
MRQNLYENPTPKVPYFDGRQCAFHVKMKISGTQVSLSTEDERPVSAGFDLCGYVATGNPGEVVAFATQR